MIRVWNGDRERVFKSCSGSGKTDPVLAQVCFGFSCVPREAKGHLSIYSDQDGCASVGVRFRCGRSTQRVAENCYCLEERNPMPGEIGGRIPWIPFESKSHNQRCTESEETALALMLCCKQKSAE